MKINQVYNISFKSKNERVRKADDLVRNVNKNFPRFSTSYANRTWFIMDDISGKYDSAQSIFRNVLIAKFNTFRDKYSEGAENDKYVKNLFKCMKEDKIGNCFEGVWLTLGSLFASGYPYSNQFSTAVRITATDKRSGEVVFSHIEEYDHTMILSSMTKDNANIEDCVVLDPWLNKAMSFDEAKVEYLSLIKDWDMYFRMIRFKKELIKHFQTDYGIIGKKLPPDFDIRNYEFKPEIVFGRHDYWHKIETFDEVKEFANFITQEYPELCMNRVV